MGLEVWRNKIDEIDAKIVELLNERFACVHEIGKWKNDRKQEIYVPEREKSLLTRLNSLNKGILPSNTLKAIYREIMSGAIAMEHPVSIAFLGPENTFTHQAAMLKFGRSIAYQPKNSIAEIFEDVSKDKVSYGVVPVENANEGAVTYTLDMFAGSDCDICSEINLVAHQYLMSQSKKTDIRVIYSHPQALGQCKNYLHKYFPSIPLVEMRSTAEAAKRAAAEDGAAAVASSLAAEFYNLNILDKRIEDTSGNITRFLVIGKQKPKATGDDKTSMMFGFKDKVGALYECLSCFGKYNINLTMIESRPARGDHCEYLFFVDFLGHIKDEKIIKMTKELEEHCVLIKVLGSYPHSNAVEVEKH